MVIIAFSSVVSGKVSLGNFLLSFGTYSNTGGSTGGDLDVGLGQVVSVMLTPNKSSVPADQHCLNDTLPVAQTAVTIVTGANENGYWIAIGRNV